MENKFRYRDQRGLQLAMMIWLAWIGFLLVGMQITLEGSPFILIAIIVLARAFLHTGLFIIAHDAMHDSLAPRNPYLNRLIGQISLFFYAGLSFKQCRYNHRLHHQSPETPEDPDFKSYSQQNIIGWYLKFMSNYLGSQQLIRLASIWIATYYIIHINSQNALYIVTIFYALPLVISSLQLFIVGTWLPHRNGHESKAAQSNQSLALPTALSFAACYHFGYHQEHHQSPSTPWFRLPTLHHNSFGH